MARPRVGRRRILGSSARKVLFSTPKLSSRLSGRPSLIFNKYLYVFQGRNSSVSVATHYGPDGPGIESRWGSRFSAPVQTGPEAHPACYTMGTGSFPGVKRPGRDVDHPPTYSAVAEERVELYIHFPPVPSWPVLGQNLPLTVRLSVA